MRKTILRSFISFIIFALVVTSMGCVSPAGAPAGEGSSGTEQTDNDQSGTQGGGAITPVSQFERYSIPMNFGTSWNQQYWTVDRDGRTITEEEQFTVLFDVLTSEPQCMVLKRLEKRGTYENGENYNTELSAVFDMDGNLIIDWDEYDYYSGFGDFIIKQQSWRSYEKEMQDQNYEGTYKGPKSELWNFITNQSFLPDVSMISRIDDGRVLLTDNASRPLGVMDGTGAKLTGFPLPERYVYARTWNSLIIAASQAMFEYDEGLPQQDFLLTPEFEELLSHESLQESYMSELLIYRDGIGTAYERSGIITLDGTELYRINPGENVIYFDDDFIVISYEDFSPGADYNPDEYYPVEYMYKIIYTANGTVITEGASLVASNLEYDYTKLSENILIYKEETLMVLNRNEGITARKEIPGISYINLLRDDVFNINLDFGGYSYTNMIVDNDLNVVMPKGSYSYIRQGMRWNGIEYEYYDVLIGDRYGERDMGWFTDLLDFDGNIMIEGLNSVFDVGYDRVSVRKGFNVGLMDWQGNWIVKRSIFSELQDD